MEIEENFDDLLKDLRENSEQNKLVKNTKLHKKKVPKPPETPQSNNLNEVMVMGQSLPVLAPLLTIQEELKPLRLVTNSKKKNEKCRLPANFMSIINTTQRETPKPPKIAGKPLQQMNENLLKDYAFIIVPDKVELSELRIKILTQQIVKRSGKFFVFSDMLAKFANYLAEFSERLKVVISSKSGFYEVFNFIY